MVLVWVPTNNGITANLSTMTYLELMNSLFRIHGSNDELINKLILNFIMLKHTPKFIYHVLNVT